MHMNELPRFNPLNLTKKVMLAVFMFLLTPVWLITPDAREITIASINFEPYYGNMENDGLLGEIVNEAFKSMGYPCTIIYFDTWKQAVKNATEGKNDGLLSLWYRPDREEAFYFSAPLPQNIMVFFRRVGTNITFKNWASLKGLTLGGVADYTYPEEFMKLNVKYSSNDRENLSHLAKGECDLALIDRFQANYYLKNDLASLKGKIETIYPIVELKTQYLGISKKTANPEQLIIDFNTGLMRIQENGLLNQLKKKYGF